MVYQALLRELLPFPRVFSPRLGPFARVLYGTTHLRRSVPCPIILRRPLHPFGQLSFRMPLALSSLGFSLSLRAVCRHSTLSGYYVALPGRSHSTRLPPPSRSPCRLALLPLFGTLVPSRLVLRRPCSTRFAPLRRLPCPWPVRLVHGGPRLSVAHTLCSPYFAAPSATAGPPKSPTFFPCLNVFRLSASAPPARRSPCSGRAPLPCSRVTSPLECCVGRIAAARRGGCSLDVPCVGRGLLVQPLPALLPALIVCSRGGWLTASCPRFAVYFCLFCFTPRIHMGCLSPFLPPPPGECSALATGCPVACPPICFPLLTRPVRLLCGFSLSQLEHYVLQTYCAAASAPGPGLTPLRPPPSAFSSVHPSAVYDRRGRLPFSLVVSPSAEAGVSASVRDSLGSAPLS